MLGDPTMNVKTLFLDTLCLNDATGYDIKKRFEVAFAHFQSVSFGAIYPALSRLQADGLIRLRVEPGMRHRDRKRYSITDVGRRSLRQELSTHRDLPTVRQEGKV